MEPQAAAAGPPARAARRWLATALHGLIILAVVAGFVALRWVETMPQRVDDQQTIVLGQTHLAPDSDGSVRVVVQDFGAGKPIAGAHVKVSLKPDRGQAVPLFEGQTDETGSLPVHFRVPADAPAEAQLVVETDSSVGRDRVEQPVTVERAYRLLLTSDKPLYQPGQTIHMRALALSTFDLAPARGATVDFLVEDPKGNKVFRHSVTASDFGIAAADFTLADLVNQGDYKLSASIGDIDESATRAEKTVEVRPYVLPKFGVSVTTDRSFYLPGERVEGAVQADYFFGKPVAQGQVQVVGSVWDVARTVVVDLRGQTDEDGTYAFSFDLPEYFAGSGLESGQAQFALEVTVIDQAEHAEQTSLVLPIAAQPLVIEAVAESGVLKPGVENIVYVLTSYPDGRPAPTQLQIRVDGGAPIELTGGEFGLAEFAFTPSRDHELDITAQDATGLTARRQVGFTAESGGDSVLLRADRAAYVVGETMHLAAFTPVPFGDVYLDIVKAGQTLSTRSTQARDGKAEFVVDVSPDQYGTLELHAYKVLLEGTIVRDTRLVVVDAPNELAIAVESDRDTYLPGEMATISFHTSEAGEQGSEGAGVQTALGVAIVDESVFALQRQDPGFAKLYFMLEQELLEPFYQVKGFQVPTAIPPEEEQIRLAQDKATQATWAGASVLAAPRPVNSRQEKMDAVRLAQGRGLGRLGRASAAALILIPPALWAVVLVVLRRSGAVKRSLVRLAVASGILLLIGAILACGLLTSYVFVEEAALIPPAVVFGLGVLAFVGYAWARRDPAAKFLALLTLAWAALVFLLIEATDRGPEPAEGLMIAALLAYVLIPGAYLLFGQVRWVQERRFSGALATGVGALAAMPAMVILPAALAFTVGGGALMGAMAPQPAGLVLEEVAAPMPTASIEVEVEKEVEASQAAGEAPRLRQYFPETLYWAPEVVTAEDGFVSLEIPMADSITTWRLTALASSQDGRLGFTTRGVRVFQDFFVDVDLPVSLTQGDEISIPIGAFNYLPEAQEVRLVVQPEPWFELLGEGEQTLTIASNDVEVVYFPIRVLAFGRRGFQVTAWGEKMSDAIRREVNVVPDGKEIRLTQSDWLRDSADRRDPLELEVEIPPQAVPETPYIEVKIYPGVMAQVVEGLEKILRLPHG